VDQLRQKAPPQWYARRRWQQIQTVLLPSLLDLFETQTCRVKRSIGLMVNCFRLDGHSYLRASNVARDLYRKRVTRIFATSVKFLALAPRAETF
jgi:hypothetical protein